MIALGIIVNGQYMHFSLPFYKARVVELERCRRKGQPLEGGSNHRAAREKSEARGGMARGMQKHCREQERRADRTAGHRQQHEA